MQAATTVRMLLSGEEALFENIADDVFDDAVQPTLVKEFLSDARHHIAVALSEDGRIVGMATGVHYVHPDKQPQMFINEVGVSPQFEGRGIGKRLLRALLDRARAIGCTEAWTATEPENIRAQTLYSRLGGAREETPFVMFNFPLHQQGKITDA